MKTKHLMIAVTGLCCAVLFGCSKEPLNNLSSEETRIYVTDYDSTVNFGTFKTYSISDSADVLDNGQSYKDLTSTDQAYIDAVNTYMQQRGYTKVSNEAKPDLAVTINRIYNTSTGYFGMSDYWDYYDGYWNPYDWGYGGYDYYVPSTYGVYQVTEGAVSVNMLDLKDAPAKGTIDIIWNGLVRGEGIFDAGTADSSVEALFNQSTYIQKN